MSAVLGFLPGTECKECKGRCCKEHGCVLSPEDMISSIEKFLGYSISQEKNIDTITREVLLDFLIDDKYGMFAIDSASHNGGRLYYLRMQHKCHNFIGIDAMGECVALTDAGCSLAYENRPKGGRMLKSDPTLRCTQMYLPDEMASDWAPYQEILASIWKEYYQKFMEDGTFDKNDDAYFEYIKSKAQQGK